MQWHWQLIIENCTGCGICRDVCEDHAIKMSRKMAYPESIEGKCIGCMDCVNECPFEAIVVTQLTGEIANFSSSS